MKKTKAKHTHDKGEIAGSLKRIADFLPAPAELAGAVPKARITLDVDQIALDFFKREAKKQKTSYQRMIRNLLTHYARATSEAR
jgi:predicted DNA binding CopG/RHH family protein